VKFLDVETVALLRHNRVNRFLRNWQEKNRMSESRVELAGRKLNARLEGGIGGRKSEMGGSEEGLAGKKVTRSSQEWDRQAERGNGYENLELVSERCSRL
jgi:hypothetical protein